ncbi:MAG: GtrA family protein [Candidatus Nitrotoga sp.]|nr:GtrA family protein [Candidatus Nitrotoga sp.]
MQNQILHADDIGHKQLVRYIISGVVATAIHYSVLTFNLNVLGMQSAGVANLLAAVVGISTSFLGSRYYVFRKSDVFIVHQASKFILLYATIACLHGLILFGWTDIWHLDYRIGFLIATGMQVSLSYWGNKILVFNK